MVPLGGRAPIEGVKKVNSRRATHASPYFTGALVQVGLLRSGKATVRHGRETLSAAGLTRSFHRFLRHSWVGFDRDANALGDRKRSLVNCACQPEAVVEVDLLEAGIQRDLRFAGLVPSPYDLLRGEELRLPVTESDRTDPAAKQRVEWVLRVSPEPLLDLARSAA